MKLNANILRNPCYHLWSGCLFTALLFAGPFHLTAQLADAERAAIAREAVDFVRDSLGAQQVHLREVEFLTPASVGEHVRQLTGVSVGAVADVWSCESRPGADACEWTGPGRSGGVIIDVTSHEFSESEGRLDFLVVSVPPELGLVEFQEGRFDFHKDPDRGWIRTGTTLVGVS